MSSAEGEVGDGFKAKASEADGVGLELEGFEFMIADEAADVDGFSLAYPGFVKFPFFVLKIFLFVGKLLYFILFYFILN